MSDKARRKELRAQQGQTPPEAGVYLIRNNATGKGLLGVTPNLGSVRNKLTFAQSTGTAAVLDRRLHDDIRRFGADAFTFDVLETLDVTPDMPPTAIQADLATLEQLWREKLDPALLY
ncbi:MAG TPA: GIY-YIG nuclease family protein [Thermomicrobiales bacterium]|nr:GIY-YIG nuclease family protein [Thermomicrobiales bacterium]